MQGACGVGEFRAVADVLGHSPYMLMKIYAHAMPDSTRAIADRIGATAIGAAGPVVGAEVRPAFGRAGPLAVMVDRVPDLTGDLVP